jgi:dynein light intermediate chain 1
VQSAISHIDIMSPTSASRNSGLMLFRLTLVDGASLFYTAPTQPTTYTLLRSYLLHRLYSIPPPLTSDNSAAQSIPIPTSHASARFPFPHRANVLDGDAVMVPSGWDSWGKINVLREGFDPARVGSALEASLGGLKDGQGVQDAERLERIWESMIPEVERVKVGRVTIVLKLPARQFCK